MTFVRSITRRVPIRFSVAGQRRDRVFRPRDKLFRRTAQGDRIDTPYGELLLDANHETERLLSYAYHNILAYYRRSELAQYIQQVAEPGHIDIQLLLLLCSPYVAATNQRQLNLPPRRRTLC